MKAISVFVFLVIISQLVTASARETMTRLARRIQMVEKDLQTEIEFRREDVKHLANLIDGLLNNTTVVVNHDDRQDSTGNDIDLLRRAFADEKMMNSVTRRKMSKLVDNLLQCEQMKGSNMSQGFSSLSDHLATIESFTKSNSEIMTTLKDLYTTMSQMIRDLPKQDIEVTRRFASCKELHDNGQRISGVYDVYPNGRPSPMKVYCDQKTDGGGWTVFQRREDGAEDFYRNWLDYKHGFGNVEGEFWLGNEFLSQLSSNCCHELRIDMTDFDNVHKFAKYSSFQVGSNDQNYLLTVSGYSGDVRDSFSIHNGSMFTTKDRDNDIYSKNCAQSFKGGWWYEKCHSSNLNGLYLRGATKSYADSVTWSAFRGQYYSLKHTEMKLR